MSYTMAEYLALLLAVAAPAVVSAAQGVDLYGQCGGIGYTGSTTCVSGAVCTSYNAYYSQCVPGTAATTSVATTLATSTTKPATSSSCKTRTSTSAASPSGTATGVKYFINFGDSYSQTGFDINSTKPSASSPLGNPPLPGWTASGGLNWVGFLTSEFNTSTLLTYNFAYGGATTDSSLVTPYEPTVLSFVDQVKEFSSSIASHPSYAPWTAANTLVGVWIGVNDVGNSYWFSNETVLLGEIMDRYFQQLQIVYDAGARNFVLLSVPPIYETPMMLLESADSQSQEKTVIEEYNSLLASRLAAFKAVNPGVTGVVVDTSVPFNTAIANPTAYGAPNATCYNADGTSCLWFNDYHPGIAINKLVAETVAKAWKGSFF